MDECYPAECIKFGCILNVTQVRFQVKGTPALSKAVGECNASLEEPPIISQGSLPLKPDQKQQPQTQTSTRSFEQQNIPALDRELHAEDHEEATEEIIYDSFPDRERDALDDIIEEAKAAEHLVSLPTIQLLFICSYTVEAFGSAGWARYPQ